MERGDPHHRAQLGRCPNLTQGAGPGLCRAPGGASPRGAGKAQIQRYFSRNARVNGRGPPFDLSQGGLEVILRADPAGTGASEYGILFRTAHGRERFTVGISQGRGEVYLDITGIPSSRGGVYSLQLPAKNGRVELRFFLDRSSLELFAAGAPCSITARLYPSSPLLVPELFACGGALQAAVELWSLKAGTG
ncbi:MAG TPA: hypothetical protein DCQ17_07760 [Firmicutes bacterium]|nr:hypothetical protein [Bacillota bacterium]